MAWRHQSFHAGTTARPVHDTLDALIACALTCASNAVAVVDAVAVVVGLGVGVASAANTIVAWSSKFFCSSAAATLGRSSSLADGVDSMWARLACCIPRRKTVVTVVSEDVLALPVESATMMFACVGSASATETFRAADGPACRRPASVDGLALLVAFTGVVSACLGPVVAMVKSRAAGGSAC